MDAIRYIKRRIIIHQIQAEYQKINDIHDDAISMLKFNSRVDPFQMADKLSEKNRIKIFGLKRKLIELK